MPCCVCVCVRARLCVCVCVRLPMPEMCWPHKKLFEPQATPVCGPGGQAPLTCVWVVRLHLDAVLADVLKRKVHQAALLAQAAGGRAGGRVGGARGRQNLAAANTNILPPPARPCPSSRSPPPQTNTHTHTHTDTHTHTAYVLRTEQPWSREVSQSTRFCSLSDTSSPVAIACTPSTAPVVENAQQEPHWGGGGCCVRGRVFNAGGRVQPMRACVPLIP